MPRKPAPRLKDNMTARIFYRDVQNTKFGTDTETAKLMVMIAVAIWKYELVEKEERPFFANKLIAIAKNIMKRRGYVGKIEKVYMKGAFVATGAFNKVNCMDLAKALSALVASGNADAMQTDTELRTWHDEFVKEVILQREGMINE